MDTLIQAIEVVLPVVLVLVLGNVFARSRGLNQEQARGLGALVFWVALPALIFRDIARTNPSSLMEFGFATSLVIIIVIMGAFSYIYARSQNLLDNEVGVVAQAAFRSNMMYVGLPVVLYHVTMGVPEHLAKAAHQRATALSALTVAIAVPLLNVGSIIFFMLASRVKMSAGKLVSASLQNPLLLAVVLGLAFHLHPALKAIIAPRTVFGETLDLASSAALPLALLSVGAILDAARVRRHWRKTLPVAALKLIIMPAFGMLVMWQVGIRETALAVGTVLLACPAAASSHAMAVEMGGDDALASDLVALTTLLCPFTLVIWLVILEKLGA